MVNLDQKLEKSIYLSPQQFFVIAGQQLRCRFARWFLKRSRRRVFLLKDMTYKECIQKYYGKDIHIIETGGEELPRINITETDLDREKMHETSIIHA